ncbi:MAG: FkbM family methyltransferase [bacterium]
MSSSTMQEFLKDDYNLDVLAPVKPVGDDFIMHVTPRFVPVYVEGYEALSTRIAKMHLARKDLFVDVGAHFGYYSLLAAGTNPDIRIIAVEPVAENVAILRMNLAQNRIDPGRASVIQAAVSSKAGHATFCVSEASDNGSLYVHPSSGTLARIQVETVCLDDLIGAEMSRRIFIKTDTDGHELEVLKGLERTLDACDDVTLLMEMNPKMMKIAGTSTAELLGHLQGKGFRIYAIDDRESRLYPLDQVEMVSMMELRYETSYYNVLCLRQEHALSVALFSHSSSLGGAERSLLDLVNGLSGRGALCTAVLPSFGPLGEALKAKGCAVYVPPGGAIQEKGWWWGPLSSDSAQAPLTGSLAVLMDVILPEMRRVAPDVVFSQTIVSPWGALCAEMLGRPHALSVREYGILDHNLSFTLGFKPSVAALYKSSDVVFCITDDVKRELFGNNYDAKIDVVYSHVEMPPVMNNTGLSSGNPVLTVGIFGAIVPGKGQGDLIRACIELLGRGYVLDCVLAGFVADSVYADALKAEIEASGHAQRFSWFGYTDAPYDLMNKVDVVVSCSRKEALGRTLLEGVLLGKPIIYSKSGGPAEIFIDGEHGLAYTHGESSDLAKAIEAVLLNRATAVARTRHAREYVLQRFSDEAYAGKIHERLRSLARQSGRSGGSSRAVGGLLIESGIGELFSRVEVNAALARVRDVEDQLGDNQEKLARASARIRALEGSLAAWRGSVFGRLAGVADSCWELACLPVRVVTYLIHPGLRGSVVNSLVRRWQRWGRGRQVGPLPELDWLLRKLDVDVPVGQVMARLGAYLTPQEEEGYRAMIGPLMAAGLGVSSTVTRARDLLSLAGVPQPRQRILFVCGEFPNPVHGGGGRVFDFIKALGLNHDVFVAAWYDRRCDHDAFVRLAPYCRGLRGFSFEDLEGGCVAKLLDFLGGVPADIVHYEWPRSLNSFDRRLGRHHIYTHMEVVSCSLAMDLRRFKPLSPEWLGRLATIMTMLRVEALDAGRVDAQVVVTAKDGEFLSRFVAGQGYSVINHGIDRDEFDVPDQPCEPDTLVYTGNFVHYPNVDAVHHFMRNIRPLILVAVPNLKVWLVGAHPPRDIQRYHDGKNVMVTGHVADVRPYIQRAAVCIAPLISGAGLRTKVVQYSALRRPCVATPIAVEDLGFESEREAYIASDPQEFARLVIKLLKDPECAMSMASRARAKALECYDNRRIAEQGLGNLYRLLDTGKELS